MKVSRSAFAGLLLVCAATTTTTTTTTFVTCNEDAEVGAPSHRRSQRSVRGGMIQPSNDNNKGQEDHEPKMKKLAMDLIDEKLLQQQNILQQGGEQQQQRSLQSVTRCGLAVEIEKCIAMVGGTPVSCDEIPSGVCKVDVAFSYNVVNTEPESPSSAPSTSFAPSTLSGKTSSGKGKAGKGGGMSNDDETVTLAFIGEAFNPQPSSTCPSDDAFLLPTDVVLAPGESKRFATNVFSVDICECQDVVFGVGLGAVGGCVAADVVRIIFATDEPSSEPSSAPSSTPSASPSDVPSAGPSSSPSETPSAGPSSSPSAAPSDVPSPGPSAAPSISAEPSDVPSAPPSSCTASFSISGATLPKQGGTTDWYLGAVNTSCDTACPGTATCNVSGMNAVNSAATLEFVILLFQLGEFCDYSEGSKFASFPSIDQGNSPPGRVVFQNENSSTCAGTPGGISSTRICCCGSNCPVTA